MPKLHPLMRIKGLVTIQHLTQPSDIGRMMCGMANQSELSSLFCCVPCEGREVVIGHVPSELSARFDTSWDTPRKLLAFPHVHI